MQNAMLVSDHDIFTATGFVLSRYGNTRTGGCMYSKTFPYLLTLLILGCLTIPADAQTVSPACTPRILANIVVDTAKQREDAGKIAEPPLTDKQNGFAWPDTPLGVIKADEGYVFFGSDGGLHSRQEWHGRWYGNDKYGSVTRTVGTLENPLGSGPPIDVTINPNPDPAVNPNYQSYDYMGGGPVYQVPAGKPGAGNLLLVYHAEIPTNASFYSVFGLASSLDHGMSWTDLGEIIRINQGYRKDLDGFDVGDSPLVFFPDNKYFTIYFPDWLANGTLHWGNLPTITSISVARAPLDAVLQAAFGSKPHAIAFEKYYDGWHLNQGLGGYSEDLDTQTPYGGTLTVAYNADLHAYQLLINAGVVVYYTDSPDGMNWAPLSLLYDFRKEKDQPSVYVAFVGMGDDPSVLGKKFYIFYTKYPNNGEGWSGASVNRFTVSCQ